MRGHRHNTPRALLALLAVIVIALMGAAPSWAALPDGRVDELVSTSGAFGEPYYPASAFDEQEAELFGSEHVFQASEDGESITYAGEAPATGGTGEIGYAEGDQWLARRTSHGWETTGISYGAVNPEEQAPGAPYEAFSPDLMAGFVMGNARDPYTAEVPMGCRSLYLRETETGNLRALVTPREVPVKTTKCGRPLFVGATDGASKVIVQSEAALTPNAEEATELPPTQEAHGNVEAGAQYGEGCMFGCNLYEASAGPLQLVNILPDGETVPNATFGGYPGPGGGASGQQKPLSLNDYSNAISAEGSTIFWTDTQEGPDLDHIYAWESGHSVQVSGAGVARYWTATPDGRFAYYTEAGRLWRFDTTTNTAEPITPEGSGVEGVIGTNQTGEDGSYLYFVADAALAPGSSARICTDLLIQRGAAEREFNEGLITAQEEQAVVERVTEEEDQEGRGDIPAETGCNLYLLHEGRTTLIAVLSPDDNRFAGGGSQRDSGDWQPGLGERTAETTPDGEHLVFESRYPLTGYDSVGPEQRTTAEAFVYSARDASLLCASCSPVGASPTVAEDAITGLSRLPVSLEDNTYMHRWISSDGDRVFFDSMQPLSPIDHNKTQDVYEWEREGTPGCPTATSAYGGCINLLSDAATETQSFLVDADATGDNVFFEHVGPLGALEAPFDRNELYDARVGGGFGGSASVCTGNTCQGIPPAPPSFEPPATAMSSAGANYPAPPSVQPRVTPAKRLTNAQKLAKAVKACSRLHAKYRRQACVRQARRRYAPARKAANSAIKPDNRG
ncbi:MAG TPA: hypothetical protein VK680_01230 [Solirubrobacteraceae bacterium]|nr:hypothetical protein [Solirubrobacteraceae bacterium]